jgi:hypothetical protein
LKVSGDATTLTPTLSQGEREPEKAGSPESVSAIGAKYFDRSLKDEDVMLELSEDGLRVIDALIKAPVAWLSPVELASIMKLGLDETTDLLATLDTGGWLAAWEREFDVVVTLSVAAASKLALRLVEVGHDEVPRWARPGEPEPPSLRAVGVFRGERAANLELVIDPLATPEEALEQAEEALNLLAIASGARERAFFESLPGPTILVGTGLCPWPGPGLGRKASCPSCGSKRLKPSMYCLYCDRWGLDHLLRDEPPPRVQVFRDPRDVARRREVERQTRKAKRKARQFATLEAERRSKRPIRRAVG